MKKKIALFIMFCMTFILFSNKILALSPDEVVKAVNDYYESIYKDTSVNPDYKMEYDLTLKRLNFNFNLENVSSSSFYWTYNEEENSIEYENNGVVNDENINKHPHVLIHLLSISNSLGYDEEQLSELLNIADKINYNDDKIELEFVDIPDGYVMEDGTDASGKILKRLKLCLDGFGGLIPNQNKDKEETNNENEKSEIIDDSIKNIIPVTNKVEITNPKTTDEKIKLVILGIIISGAFVIIGCNKIKKKRNS